MSSASSAEALSRLNARILFNRLFRRCKVGVLHRRERHAELHCAPVLAYQHGVGNAELTGKTAKIIGGFAGTEHYARALRESFQEHDIALGDGATQFGKSAVEVESGEIFPRCHSVVFHIYNLSHPRAFRNGTESVDGRGAPPRFGVLSPRSPAVALFPPCGFPPRRFPSPRRSRRPTARARGRTARVISPNACKRARRMIKL